MTTFWPSDLNIEDTSSPLDILDEAKQEWLVNSNQLLTLVVQPTVSASGDQRLIVHAKHIPSNRTTTIFVVIHRVGSAYPARIVPRSADLPQVLKKTYYQRGITDIGVGFGSLAGRTVQNELVCDTPGEFRTNLNKVFNLGSLKSEIISLISVNVTPVESEDNNE